MSTLVMSWYLPSGKLTVCELENGPVEIVSFPINSMVDLSNIFHSYVSLPEGNLRLSPIQGGAPVP